MGEIVYLNDVRVFMEEMAQLKRKESKCREINGVSICAECEEIGECPIHQRMMACEAGDLDYEAE